MDRAARLARWQRVRHAPIVQLMENGETYAEWCEDEARKVGL